MENEVKKESVKAEKKGNKGLIFVLVLIIVTLLGLVAYLFFSKDVFGFKVSKDTSGSVSTVVNNETKSDAVVTQSPDELYKLYLEKLANQIKTRFNNQDSTVLSYAYASYYMKLVGDEGQYQTGNFKINEKLELIYNKEDISGPYLIHGKTENLKVADNVVYMSLMQDGTSTTYSLYYITADGSVYRAHQLPTPNPISYYFNFLDAEKLNVKNIVAITEAAYCDKEMCSGWHGPMFIDIEGNISDGDIKW